MSHVVDHRRAGIVPSGIAAHQTVAVQLFAGLRDACGVSSVTIAWHAGMTAGELRSRLSAEYPQAGALIGRSAVAIDHEYRDDSAIIPRDGSTALIPPVSGG